MKKMLSILITALLLSFPSGAFGQKERTEDPVLKIFDKYEEKEGVESITISPSLLGMMKNGKNNDKKTQDMISKISGLRILTFSDGEDGKRKSTRETLISDLQSAIKKDYEEIMKIKNTGEKIELYVRQTPNCKDCKNMSALLFITSANSSVTVMHLAGNIDKSLIDAVMNGDIGTSSN